MSDYGGIGKAIQGLWYFAIVSTVIAWPLGIWKLIEILIYIYNNVHWGPK